MRVRTRTRARWWGLAVGVATAGAATAQPPVAIEVYHGTNLVSPAPRGWEPEPFPAPVVPASAGPVRESAVVPAAPLPVAPPPSAPAQPLPFPIPQVVVIRESAPAPTPTPAPLPAPSPAPSVVVVKEPAAPAPVPAGTDVKDWLLAGCAGAGLMLLGLVAARRPRTAPAAPVVVTAAPPAEPKPPARLIGGYDIGPAPTTAQKFDVGPSYHEERQEKERAEEQVGAAVLEFLVQQNLALRDQLAAEPAAAEPSPPTSSASPAPAGTKSLLTTPAPADEFAAWVEASKARGPKPQHPREGS